MSGEGKGNVVLEEDYEEANRDDGSDGSGENEDGVKRRGTVILEDDDQDEEEEEEEDEKGYGKERGANNHVDRSCETDHLSKDDSGNKNLNEENNNNGDKQNGNKSLNLSLSSKSEDLIETNQVDGNVNGDEEEDGDDNMDDNQEEEEALDLSVVTTTTPATSNLTAVPWKKRKLDKFRESKLVNLEEDPNTSVVFKKNSVISSHCFPLTQKKTSATVTGAAHNYSVASLSAGSASFIGYPRDGSDCLNRAQGKGRGDSVPLPLTRKSPASESGPVPTGGGDRPHQGAGTVPAPSAKGLGCGRPGYITCSICNATKYYSHVQRRFGQFSCEPCSKFMKRFLRDPKTYTCLQIGRCQIGRPPGEQEPRGVSVSRCKACWLRICLEKFTLDADIRTTIDKYYAPKFNCDTRLPLSKADNDDKVELASSVVASQNYPPPLPLPVRKRKLKTVSSEGGTAPRWPGFPNESARKASGNSNHRQTPLPLPPSSLVLVKSDTKSGSVGNGVISSSSTSSPPDSPRNSYDGTSKPFLVKKPLMLRRDSYPSENQSHSKDLYPDYEDGDYEKGEDECGRCTYCLQSKDSSSANVVVVKESCKYMKCILTGFLSGNPSSGGKDDRSTIPPLIPAQVIATTNVSSLKKLENPAKKQSTEIEYGSAFENFMNKSSRASATTAGNALSSNMRTNTDSVSHVLNSSTTVTSPVPTTTMSSNNHVSNKVSTVNKTKSFLNRQRNSGTNQAIIRRSFAEAAGLGSENNFLDEILNANSPFL